MPIRKLIQVDSNEEALLRRLLERVSSMESSGNQSSNAFTPDSYRALARETLEYRRRRYRYFPRGMLGEPAFDMMLCLYVAEFEQRFVTYRMLAEMADVPFSSAHRWIDFLVGRGFLDRAKHPTDARAIVLALTPQARKSLESLFEDIARVGRGASFDSRAGGGDI